MTSNRLQAETIRCCDVAVLLAIRFMKSYILHVQFGVLIISCCEGRQKSTMCILQGCYSSILTPDGKLDVQLHFTAKEPLKGQWSSNCRFLLIAAVSRLPFLFCTDTPGTSLSLL